LPAFGSVGLSFILAIFGFALYILSLLIVALVLYYEPFLPPDGSGLFGLVLAPDFLKAEPLPEFLEALAAEYF
jgi:hypothetical protein